MKKIIALTLGMAFVFCTTVTALADDFRAEWGYKEVYVYKGQDDICTVDLYNSSDELVSSASLTEGEAYVNFSAEMIPENTYYFIASCLGNDTRIMSNGYFAGNYYTTHNGRKICYSTLDSDEIIIAPEDFGGLPYDWTLESISNDTVNYIEHTVYSNYSAGGTYTKQFKFAPLKKGTCQINLVCRDYAGVDDKYNDIVSFLYTVDENLKVHFDSMLESYYSYTDDYVFADGCIERYTGSDENVVIPEEINGEKVTKIGPNAFYKNECVKTIHIPATVTQIWEDSLQYYGLYPFLDASSLEAITVAENNPNFKDIDGVLVDKNKNELLFYPQNKQGESYTVPMEIESVRTLAFAHYNNLKNIYFYNDTTRFTTLSVGYGDLTIHCIKGSGAEAYAKDSFELRYIADKGDADVSGAITANDAATVLSYALNGAFSETLSNCMAVCDVNGDGSITAADSALIMQNVLDKNVEFSADNNKVLI